MLAVVVLQQAELPWSGVSAAPLTTLRFTMHALQSLRGCTVRCWCAPWRCWRHRAGSSKHRAGLDHCVWGVGRGVLQQPAVLQAQLRSSAVVCAMYGMWRMSVQSRVTARIGLC